MKGYRNPTLLKVSLFYCACILNLVGLIVFKYLQVNSCLFTRCKSNFYYIKPVPTKPSISLSILNTSNVEFPLNPFEIMITEIVALTEKPSVEKYPKFSQRGEYWVGYNKIPALKQFRGHESITLTTPSDHTYLDNLIPLAELWQGPISCAVYSPGTDYLVALSIIHYLRECSPLVKNLVSFHMFFDRQHIPENISTISWENLTSVAIDCQKIPEFGKTVVTYRGHRKLHFPINVARNIARETASTHFVLASDIELYPSTNVIEDFFHIIRDARFMHETSSDPKVFVLPVFELHENVTSVPKTKTELKRLLDMELALSFHQNMCNHCHNIPKFQEWIQNVNGTTQEIHSVVKRQGEQASWEPIYIGTKSDPMYDERITWEGRNNKKIQAYTMCLLGYDYYVLNNAFLVHRPEPKKQFVRTKSYLRMKRLLKRRIIPELNNLMGFRNGCSMVVY